jgi:phosphoribosylformylglycinamidine synthase
VAVAESCLAGGIGASVELGSELEELFGEGPGGFVVSGPREALEALGGRVIGEAGGEALEAGELTVSLDELRAAHDSLASVLA